MADGTNGAENTNTNDNVQDNGADLTALQAELAKFKAENEKLKNAQSNASADASKFKKLLNERMTEQEKAAAETKELIETLKAENEALKRSQALAEHEAGFVGAGFESETAKKAAEAKKAEPAKPVSTGSAAAGQSAQTNRCAACGTVLQPNDRFCIQCGTKVEKVKKCLLYGGKSMNRGRRFFYAFSIFVLTNAFWCDIILHA